MHESVHPTDLLKHLLGGNHGHISLDSLVVRREILTNAFLFDESLRLGQDTDFMYRLAGVYRLYAPEDVEVVAFRGVHEGNRVFRFEEAAMYRQRVLRKCIRHRYYGCTDYDTAVVVIKRYLEKSGWTRISRYLPLPLSVKRNVIFIAFCITHPSDGLYLMRLVLRES